MSDGAQRVLRSWTAAAPAPSTSAPRRRLDVAAPLLPLLLPSDGGKKSGGPDLRPDVLQHSSSIHRRRPDVAAPFISAVLPLDGGKKNGGPDLRPDVLQPSSPVYRRRPNVAAPFVPAVLTLDGVEESSGPDPRTVFTCNCQRHICLTRSEHVLICEKNMFSSWLTCV